MTTHRLDLAWPVAIQRARALDSLVANGLLIPAAQGRWALPDSTASQPVPGEFTD